MALDGMTIHALVRELNRTIAGRRIAKIAQPEPEALLITVKQDRGQVRLFLSANPSLPLIYLTDQNRPGPVKAPNFCMVLRKYIGSGTITAVEQPGGDRQVRFSVQHLDELGDLRTKYLYVEIMGKHSNIIFCDENDRIIDSIRHVGADMSSVREVLPGRQYFLPVQEGKRDPFSLKSGELVPLLLSRPYPAGKAVYQSLTGFSPLLSEELLYRSGIDSTRPLSESSRSSLVRLQNNFRTLIEQITTGTLEPVIVYDHETKKPLEFAPVRLTMYEEEDTEPAPSVSRMLETFYARKDVYTNMHQKSQDIRKLTQNLLSRNEKKLALQEKQLDDTKKADRMRKCGELLRAYAYQLKPGEKEVTLPDYTDDNRPVKIRLDPEKTAIENANRYFDKYQKLKRTKEELTVQTEETEKTITHLQSILVSIDLAENDGDLAEIRKELENAGFVRHKAGKGPKKEAKAKPLHFMTDDGFHIYVGKNNTQNEEVTFSLAAPEDWWFHAKGLHGSHVIVKTDGKTLPDHDFEAAAALAAYYSEGRNEGKTEVDYVRKREVKKTPGTAKGYVIYYTNYSMTVRPEIPSSVKIVQ